MRESARHAGAPPKTPALETVSAPFPRSSPSFPPSFPSHRRIKHVQTPRHCRRRRRRPRRVNRARLCRQGPARRARRAERGVPRRRAEVDRGIRGEREGVPVRRDGRGADREGRGGDPEGRGRGGEPGGPARLQPRLLGHGLLPHHAPLRVPQRLQEPGPRPRALCPAPPAPHGRPRAGHCARNGGHGQRARGGAVLGLCERQVRVQGRDPEPGEGVWAQGHPRCALYHRRHHPRPPHQAVDRGQAARLGDGPGRHRAGVRGHVRAAQVRVGVRGRSEAVRGEVVMARAGGGWSDVGLGGGWMASVLATTGAGVSGLWAPANHSSSSPGLVPRSCAKANRCLSAGADPELAGKSARMDGSRTRGHRRAL